MAKYTLSISNMNYNGSHQLSASVGEIVKFLVFTGSIKLRSGSGSGSGVLYATTNGASPTNNDKIATYTFQNATSTSFTTIVVTLVNGGKALEGKNTIVSTCTMGGNGSLSLSISYVDSVVKRYDGAAFKKCSVNVHNGTSFAICTPYVYDGSEWQPCNYD